MSYELRIEAVSTSHVWREIDGVMHEFLPCGCLWYCADPEPWNPQTEWGWCWHVLDEEGTASSVSTSPFDAGTCKHYCPPGCAS